MPDLTQLIIIALVEGITEFLPISSSAHLVLLPQLLDWPDQGQSYDIAVHFGALLAICLVLRRDCLALVRDSLHAVITLQHQGASRLAVLLLIATLPTAILGLLLLIFDPLWLRSVLVIIVSTASFAILLALADFTARQQRDITTLTKRDALLIGLAQMVALIPGTSRSGITITAGLLLGFTRTDAARFSFLLAIPVIALAAIAKIPAALATASTHTLIGYLLAIVVSFVSAWLVAKLFLRVIAQIGMLPFVIYRLLLAGVLLTAS